MENMKKIKSKYFKGGFDIDNSINIRTKCPTCGHVESIEFEKSESFQYLEYMTDIEECDICHTKFPVSFPVVFFIEN